MPCGLSSVIIKRKSQPHSHRLGSFITVMQYEWYCNYFSFQFIVWSDDSRWHYDMGTLSILLALVSGICGDQLFLPKGVWNVEFWCFHCCDTDQAVTLYYGCDYLSMLGLKLIHVNQQIILTIWTGNIVCLLWVKVNHLCHITVHRW